MIRLACVTWILIRLAVFAGDSPGDQLYRCLHEKHQEVIHEVIYLYVNMGEVASVIKHMRDIKCVAEYLKYTILQSLEWEPEVVRKLDEIVTDRVRGVEKIYFRILIAGAHIRAGDIEKAVKILNTLYWSCLSRQLQT